MKMCFLFSGLFWGVVLILLGISLIIKVFFHIDIPIFRIIFALILIYWGIRLLTGGCQPRSCSNIVFNKSRIEATKDGSKYSVVFGKGTIDLRSLAVQDGSKAVKVDVVFGNSIVLINPDVPCRINCDVVFGSLQLPGQGTTPFGTTIYTTKTYTENTPHLVINLDVVFGSVEVKEIGGQ